MLQRTCGVLKITGVATTASAAENPSPAPSAPPPQTEDDEYTRYELLGPGTAAFRIVYEVTATTPGATCSSTPSARAASRPTRRCWTGSPDAPRLRRGRGRGGQGRRPGRRRSRHALHPDQLARPVPEERGDPAAHRQDVSGSEELLRRGGTIVFSRSLGIKRNSVVLPPGYELVPATCPPRCSPRPMAASWSAS